MSDRIEALRKFVEQAGRVSADFTLPVRTSAELREVLDVIGGHNDYDPRKAADMLGPLVGEMSRVRVEQFVSGPALWFELPFWTHQRIDDDGKRLATARKYTVEERQEMAAKLRQIGRELRADEIGVRQFDHEATMDWRGTGDKPREVRLWWD